MSTRFALLMVAIGLLTFGVLDVKDYAQPATASTPHTVTYVVENQVSRAINGFASVTSENGTGGTEQDDVALPWRKDFVAEPGQTLYVSAQQNDDINRGIKVSILVDGETVRHAESTARYGIATASARMR